MASSLLLVLAILADSITEPPMLIPIAVTSAMMAITSDSSRRVKPDGLRDGLVRACFKPPWGGVLNIRIALAHKSKHRIKSSVDAALPAAKSPCCRRRAPPQ